MPICTEDAQKVAEQRRLSTAPVCSECNKPGAELLVGEKSFHADCFRCSSCGMHLRKYYARDGKYYCEIDYQRYYPDLCRSCGETFSGTDTIFRCKKHKFHARCFVCSICQSPITENEPNSLDNLILVCSKHRDPAQRAEMNAPPERCEMCGLSLIDDITLAENKKYHPGCFLCKHCRSPLRGQFYRGPQGGYYCERDYFAVYGSKCLVCNAIIKDDCISADGKDFHVACARCAQCQKAIRHGEKLGMLGDALYCERDYLEQAKLQHAKATSPKVAHAK